MKCDLSVTRRGRWGTWFITTVVAIAMALLPAIASAGPAVAAAEPETKRGLGVQRGEYAGIDLALPGWLTSGPATFIMKELGPTIARKALDDLGLSNIADMLGLNTAANQAAADAAILQQLQMVEGQLDNIATDVEQLNSDFQALSLALQADIQQLLDADEEINCNVTSSSQQQYIGNLQTAWNDFTNLAQNPGSQTALDEWTDSYNLDFFANNINGLQTGLMDNSAQQGALHQCVQSLFDAATANKANSQVDDTAVYESITAYFGYYYGWQARAMLMYTSWYRYFISQEINTGIPGLKALSATATQANMNWAQSLSMCVPETLTSLPVMANSKLLNDVTYNCNNLQTQLTDWTNALITQAMYIGIPYGLYDPNLSTQANSKNVWLTNLEAWDPAGAADCNGATTLNSTGPACGNLATTNGTQTPTGSYQLPGGTNPSWTNATATDWNSLLAPSSGTFSTAMQAQGFTNTDNKIIYPSAETMWVPMQNQEGMNMQCFFDTAWTATSWMTPICGNGYTANMGSPLVSQAPGSCPVAQNPTNCVSIAGVAPETSSNSNYYNMFAKTYVRSDDSVPGIAITTAPGWQAGGQAQYQWPVFDGSAIPAATCTSGPAPYQYLTQSAGGNPPAGPANIVGSPVVCGEALQAILNLLVPTQPVAPTVSANTNGTALTCQPTSALEPFAGTSNPSYSWYAEDGNGVTNTATGNSVSVNTLLASLDPSSVTVSCTEAATLPVLGNQSYTSSSFYLGCNSQLSTCLTSATLPVTAPTVSLAADSNADLTCTVTPAGVQGTFALLSGSTTDTDPTSTTATSATWSAEDWAVAFQTGSAQFTCQFIAGDFEVTSNALQCSALVPSCGPAVGTPAIGRLHLKLGGAKGILGKRVGSEKPIGEGGRIQSYANGVIVYHKATGPHYLVGKLASKFAATSGGTGQLGFPTSNPKKVGKGTVARFQNGQILQHRSNKPRIVAGLIWQTYRAAGAAAGKLGFPVSDERSTRRGRAQAFQFGKITVAKKSGKATVQMKRRAA